MASLPKKGIKGTNFKVWAVETLNALIDYLHGARVKPGYGISVRETPSGTIVELAKKEAPIAQFISGGTASGAQNLSVSVAGNTASVALSGSTSRVDFVGTGSVEISGGTPGRVELGGGVPLPVRPVSIGFNGSHVMSHDGWAYMACTIYSYGNSGEVAFAYLRVVASGTTTDYLVACNGLLTIEGESAGSIMVPVAIGSTVSAYFDIPSDGNYTVGTLLPNGITVYD